MRRPQTWPPYLHIHVGFVRNKKCSHLRCIYKKCAQPNALFAHTINMHISDWIIGQCNVLISMRIYRKSCWRFNCNRNIISRELCVFFSTQNSYFFACLKPIKLIHVHRPRQFETKSIVNFLISPFAWFGPAIGAFAVKRQQQATPIDTNSRVMDEIRSDVGHLPVALNHVRFLLTCLAIRLYFRK